MIKLNKALCFILFLFLILFLVFLSNNSHQINCELSRIESDDFFCETNQDWSRRKELFYLQHNHNRFRDTPTWFFQDNYEPTFSCRFEQRLGINGDGGKWICDIYRLKQLKSCLIYSIGSNGEFSFENETKHYLPHCDIHTFDVKQFNCTDICTFHQAKIGNGLNGSKTLRMIMAELNHIERYIDILKIDIEGGEYEFFDELFNTTDHLSENIRQIIVEIHLSGITGTVNNVTVYDYEKIHHLFELFHEKHYVIFHKEVNLYNAYNTFEYCFIKLNKKFFQMDHRQNVDDEFFSVSSANT